MGGSEGPRRRRERRVNSGKPHPPSSGKMNSPSPKSAGSPPWAPLPTLRPPHSAGCQPGSTVCPRHSAGCPPDSAGCPPDSTGCRPRLAGCPPRYAVCPPHSAGCPPNFAVCPPDCAGCPPHPAGNLPGEPFQLAGGAAIPPERTGFEHLTPVFEACGAAGRGETLGLPGEGFLQDAWGGGCVHAGLRE